MHFPGWIVAIPVVATALVINAGGAGAVAGPSILLRAKPLQWIGARSYAIYLWHFPMLILAERKWGPLSVPTRAGLLVGSLVLAAISYHLVENPVRHNIRLSALPVRSLAMGAWIALVGIGASLLLLNNPPTLAAGGEASPATLVSSVASSTPSSTPSGSSVPTTAHTPATGDTSPTSSPSTHAGDASHDNPAQLQALIDANLSVLKNGIATQKVPSNLSPSLTRARNDLPSIYHNGCILDLGTNTPKGCIYGATNGATTVVLFGDSHAAQWMPAMNKVAAAHGWKLIVQVKKACPTAEIPTAKDPGKQDCWVWRQRVIDSFATLKPDLVVMSAYRYQLVGSAAGRDSDTVWQEGLDATVAKVRPNAGKVLLLGDSATPSMDVPSCVAGHLSSVPSCMNSRQGATRPSRLAVEREVAAKHDSLFIPTSDWMCTDTQCPVIVGNTLMYRDNSHVTATASLLLSPYIDAALRLALG
jgi:hypothetical protein